MRVIVRSSHRGVKKGWSYSVNRIEQMTYKGRRVQAMALERKQKDGSIELVRVPAFKLELFPGKVTENAK